MTFPPQANAIAADATRDEAMGQPAGLPHSFVPGLREAVAAAFSVPAGPAMLLALVLQQIHGQFAEASSGLDEDQMMKPASQPLGNVAAGWESAGGQPAPAQPGHANEGLIADRAAVGSAQSNPVSDERDEPAHDLDGPIVRQSQAPAAVGQPCESNPANPAGADGRGSGTGILPGSLPSESHGQDAPGVWEPAHTEDLPPAARWVPLPGGISRAPTPAETMARHPQRVLEILDRHAREVNDTLDRLAEDARHRRQQTIALVESILASQAGLAQRLEQLEAGFGNARNTQTGG